MLYPMFPPGPKSDPFSAVHHEHEALRRQREDPTDGRGPFRSTRSYPCGCVQRNIDDGPGRPAGWTFCEWHKSGRDLEDAQL